MKDAIMGNHEKAMLGTPALVNNASVVIVDEQSTL
jgi:hypothetical protein